MGAKTSESTPEWFVTHYACEHREVGMLRPLGFLTQIAGDQDNYYYGLDPSHPVESASVDQMVNEGTVRKLPSPKLIVPGESLWLTPEGDVILADREQPLGPRGTQLLDTLDLQHK